MLFYTKPLLVILILEALAALISVTKYISSIKLVKLSFGEMVEYIRDSILIIGDAVVVGISFSAIRYIILHLCILYNYLNLND